MSDHFDKLPWFIKEYVHACRWSGFRDIQSRTFDLFYGTDDHILISAGTSTGKTEAAMFPVISSLYNNPCDGIGALYIGPLKALIDDQFERMGPILGESELKVTGWHGDIGHSHKRKLMEEPSGILQITPESLQNLITNYPEEIKRLFGSLRFVVIDEVHAFMESDRGLQLLCCLQRIEVMAGCDPRRIGLSATISDTGAAAEWLSADTGRHTSVVSDDSVGEKRISIRYNMFPIADEEEEGRNRKRAITSYYTDLFRETHGFNSIVFTNSRLDAEKVAKSLRLTAEAKGYPDEVSIHHGSISPEYRRFAIEHLKDPSRRTTAVATVTLELGIDIGDLDRIIQINAPFTCSGMTQRMGRSGRRGGVQELIIMCNEDAEDWWSSVDGVDMDLIKAIAMADLVMNDRWTESPVRETRPFGLLYHQTMSYLRSGIGCKFSVLVSDILSLYPFRDISKEEYRLMIQHLANIKHVEMMEDGTILIGPDAERVVYNREFCSVFSSKREIVVKNDGKPVGSIQNLPRKDELIQLAGRVWKVIKIIDKSIVEVEESDGDACTPWRSGIPNTDTEIMKRMRDVLSDDTDYPFLDAAARQRLCECRKAARSVGMTSCFVPKEGGFRMYPWVGTVRFDTLRRVLQKVVGTDSVRSMQLYYIDVRTRLSPDNVMERVHRYLELKDPITLVDDEDLLRYGKFDRYIPEALLVRAYASDRLDTDL